MGLPRDAISQIPCMCARLRGATRVVSRMYDEQISAAGVRGTQFSLLMVLSHTGPIRQGEIAEAMLADATTLSRTLPPLEREGWIVSSEGEDRRERVWAITPLGRKKLDAARGNWTKVQNQLREGLTASEWETLGTLLAKVSRVAQAAEE